MIILLLFASLPLDLVAGLPFSINSAITVGSHSLNLRRHFPVVQNTSVTNVSIDVQSSTTYFNCHPLQSVLHDIYSNLSLPTVKSGDVGWEFSPTSRSSFLSSMKPPVVQISPAFPGVDLNDTATVARQPVSARYGTAQHLLQLGAIVREFKILGRVSRLQQVLSSTHVALSHFPSALSFRLRDVMGYPRSTKVPTQTNGVNMHPTTLVVALLQCGLCCLTFTLLAFFAVLVGYRTRQSSTAPTNSSISPESILLMPLEQLESMGFVARKYYQPEIIEPAEDDGHNTVFLKLFIHLQNYAGDETYGLPFVPPIIRTALYVPKERVGEGACGAVVVYTCIDGHDDLPMEIAVKWMSPDEDEEMDYVLKVVENEMRISTAVNALPGMAKLITGQDNYQVMEFYNNGTFDDILFLIPTTFSRREIYIYLAEMIVATRRLHQLGIIHRDLKPSNIFIGPDNHIRIGDFGIAHMFDPPTEEFLSRPDWSNWVNAYRNHLECMKRGEGLSNDFPSLWADLRTPWVTRETWCTPIFSAPEVMRPEPYSFGIDFYSIGVIAHLFLTGDYPFDDPVSDESTGKRVMNFSPLLLPEEKDFITGMLRPEQMERFGYKEMLDHEMFREIDWDAIESGSVVGISGDWETEMEVRYERYKELYETVKKLSQEDAAEDVTTT